VPVVAVGMMRAVNTDMQFASASDARGTFRYVLYRFHSTPRQTIIRQCDRSFEATMQLQISRLGTI